MDPLMKARLAAIGTRLRDVAEGVYLLAMAAVVMTIPLAAATWGWLKVAAGKAGEVLKSTDRHERRRLLFGVAGVAALVIGWAWHEVPGNWLAYQRGERPLYAAQTWHYQLDKVDVEQIAKVKADVIVTDFARNGGRIPLTPDEVARLKTGPDGKRRLVISYMSIGEAETWRSYWKSCCASGAPSWLTGRTQGWAGNYVVKFWEPGWKAIVAQRVRSILAQGYDGFYLDRVDTYENVKAPGGSRAAMIQFVREVASQARSIKGDAAILVQNAEELLDSDSYASAIDGIAKEDLFHGASHNGQRNPSAMVAGSLGLLKRAKARGKAIFVVEYLSGSTASSVAAEIRRQGFVPNFAGRSLSN
jgi:cysteinyl-tRNA synthetase